jgi:hypothetical protein
MQWRQGRSWSTSFSDIDWSSTLRTHQAPAVVLVAVEAAVVAAWVWVLGFERPWLLAGALRPQGHCERTIVLL